MTDGAKLSAFPDMGANDEKHLAREVRLMRVDVKATLDAINGVVVPALSNLADRVGQIEARVETLERERFAAAPQPRWFVSPLLVGLLLLASMAGLVFAVLLAPHI